MCSTSAESEAGDQERGYRRADGGERQGKKGTWGILNGRWVPHDTRDEIIDYVRRWSARTELAASQFMRWLGIGQSKY